MRLHILPEGFSFRNIKENVSGQFGSGGGGLPKGKPGCSITAHYELEIRRGWRHAHKARIFHEQTPLPIRLPPEILGNFRRPQGGFIRAGKTAMR